MKPYGNQGIRFKSNTKNVVVAALVFFSLLFLFHEWIKCTCNECDGKFRFTNFVMYRDLVHLPDWIYDRKRI